MSTILNLSAKGVQAVKAISGLSQKVQTDHLAETQTINSRKMHRRSILNDYKWPGKYKPFEHQKQTAEFLTLNRKAFCFNEQGTGKTASAIWASDYLMEQGYIRRVLVICPVSIMQAAWQSDLFKFAVHRHVDVAHGDRKKRKAIVEGVAEYVIINYDGVGTVYKEILDGGFDMIVIDEANAYKNAQTTRWKILNSILTPDTWLWMMTGTPASQSPVDAYGLARLVCPQRVPKFSAAWRDKVMYQVSRFRWLPKRDAQETVFDAVSKGVAQAKALREEYEALSVGDWDDASHHRLDELQSKLEALSGWNWEQRVHETLDRLHLDADIKISNLSGGTKKRGALARALV